MLKQRVITAIILLFILIPIVFSSNVFYFKLFVFLLTGIAAWEWGRLSKLSFEKSIAFSGFVLLMSSFFHYFDNQYYNVTLYAAFLFWVLGVFLFIKLGVEKWGEISLSFSLVLGVLVLSSSSICFVLAREVGVNYLLSIFSIVWVSDVAAYFGGKTFGRRKLAPAISPGKSWEGVFSGMFMVLICGFLWIWFDKENSVSSYSFYTLLYKLNSFIYFPILLFVTGVGVAGDLFESMMKRSAGVKDSSDLLPGHGGVLDRIDALIPVLTVTMIVQKFLL